MIGNKLLGIGCVMASLAASLPVAAATKPVRVFILAGQSNMEGHGFVPADPKRNGGKGSLEFLVKDAATAQHFAPLVDAAGQWRQRDDVWISYLDRQGPLTAGYGARPDMMGPELGFGWVMGDALKEPVLLIKCAWGGKSLAVDFRPPSAGKPPYSLGAKTDAAIAEDPAIVGKYYRETLARTKAALAHVKDLVPGSDGRYVLAGFGWHQGWNDRINPQFNAEYETNLVRFIRDLRRDLGAPGLPFVIAETGMNGPAENNPRALSLMKAQAAVAAHAEFKGNVAFVGTRTFWRPPEQSPNAQGYHWNSNAETYYLIGEAMGEAMKHLLGANRLPAVDRPHVLLIHADQVRMDAVGAYGNPQIKMPAIDELAAAGVRFRNSFCSFPVCTPSRYSLLSGLPVHEHRGWDNHCTLPPGTPTFASLLREAGYATKAVGKMHFTPTYLDVGFNEMELAEQDGPGRWDDDYHRDLRRLGLVDANDLEDQRAEYRKDARRAYWEAVGALPSNLDEASYSTTWIGDRAVATLETWEAHSPALLMVGFIKPHHPFDPPEPWAHQYDPDKLSLLPGWLARTPAPDLALHRGYFTNAVLTEASVRRATALYYASLSELDAQIGRMLQVLKAKGLYDSTLIIFTSDHGEYLGFHHLLLKSNHLYDPLAKVPLIIKYPRRLGAGSVRDDLVSNVDVAPTILKAAGLNLPPAMRGQNLADPTAAREIVFCETRPQVMARTRTSKLILDTANPTRSLFFDLEKDPLEMTNRFSDPGWKEEVARLTHAIDSWRPARLPEVYLNEGAPQIQQPNLPRDPAHRAEIADWYARAMQHWRATNGAR